MCYRELRGCSEDRVARIQCSVPERPVNRSHSTQAHSAEADEARRAGSSVRSPPATVILLLVAKANGDDTHRHRNERVTLRTL